MTTVSAIVNLYDEDPAFVAEALASVDAQSRAVDEIIAVQDGGPRDYAAFFARRPDVHFVRQQNRGLAAARNTGLAAAKGDFVLFLDADDRLMPGAVAWNLARLSQEPSAPMAYGGWRYIDAAGRPRPPAVMAPMGRDAYATFLAGNCVGMHGTVLYRRDVLRRVGGFDASYRACEDYELYLQLARLGPIPNSPGEVLAEYRLHGANMSLDHGMMLKTVLRVLDEQTPHLRGRPDWQAARRRGVGGWKAHYAHQQSLDILDLRGDPANAWRVLASATRVLALAPRALATAVLAEANARRAAGPGRRA
jgi:glycosyltransferase involved in cell wall biosynthesis